MKCSICIASYNKPRYLRATLASIYGQQPPFAFEVIVVDDGSPGDETVDVCQEYPVVYHRIDREPGFRNQSAARNIAYRMARGDVVISQADDTIHITPNTIERLVSDLLPGTFLIANVFNTDADGNKVLSFGITEYTGPTRQKPFFFLGSLYRRDICRVGGNDEEFMIAPSYEDDWFGHCLTKGLGLTPIFSTEIVGHHLDHPRTIGSADVVPSARLYQSKYHDAMHDRHPWCVAAGPWPWVDDPLDPYDAGSLLDLSSKPMIPRRMNFFWSGKRMSFMRYLTLASFRHWNPNFPITLWSTAINCQSKTWASKERDDGQYAGPDYMPQVEALNIQRKTWVQPRGGLTHTHASDLFRWELLSTDGGFYCDMDVLWVRSMEPLYAKHQQADAIFCMECGGTLCAIGFFGASSGCPIFGDIRTAALRNYTPGLYESAGAVSVSRAAGLDHDVHAGQKIVPAFCKRYPELRIVQVPDETLYHFDCNTYPAIYDTTAEVPEGVVGIHWFGGAQASQKWNNLLTADNLHEFDNTFCKYARML